MAKEPLSNVDTAWLRMEDPTNLMMITGVMVFGAPLDYEHLRAILEHDLLRFDRFRQRIVRSWRPGGGYHWIDDPDFDINYHLQRASLPAPGDQAALQDTASLLAATQLEMTRPLWQLHLVDDYGDGCALICRLHHSIADGLALVHVLLSLAEPGPDAPWPVLQPQPAPPGRGRRLGRLVRPLRSTCSTAGRFANLLLHEGREVCANPSRAFDPVRMGAGGATALGKLLLRWPDPRTAFKGELGVPKRTAWSEPLVLQDVKAVGRDLEGTVNDVLLTAMAGGLRRYLEDRGELVDGLDFRAIVPVNLRQPGTEHELGNKFGLVFLALPIGIQDPAVRLHELRRRMDGLKGSLEPPVTYGILHLIGGAPSSMQDVVVDIFETKGTAVMTNVIGPKEQLYLAGAPLEAMMFWVPQSGRLGLGVSILSYADRVWLGVIADEGLVPDPESIVSGFHTEFDELLVMARGRKGMTTFKEMAAMLDGALETVDTMLEEQAVPEAAEAAGEERGAGADPLDGRRSLTEPTEAAPQRCGALTKAGKPCKNNALPGSQFCRMHQGAGS